MLLTIIIMNKLQEWIFFNCTYINTGFGAGLMCLATIHSLHKSLSTSIVENFVIIM